MQTSEPCSLLLTLIVVGVEGTFFFLDIFLFRAAARTALPLTSSELPPTGDDGREHEAGVAAWGVVAPGTEPATGTGTAGAAALVPAPNFLMGVLTPVPALLGPSFLGYWILRVSRRDSVTHSSNLLLSEQQNSHSQKQANTLPG